MSLFSFIIVFFHIIFIYIITYSLLLILAIIIIIFPLYEAKKRKGTRQYVILVTHNKICTMRGGQALRILVAWMNRREEDGKGVREGMRPVSCSQPGAMPNGSERHEGQRLQEGGYVKTHGTAVEGAVAGSGL